MDYGFILKVVWSRGVSDCGRVGEVRLLTHLIASYPLQAYVFAKILEVFQYRGKQLIDRGNFWSLMFFVLALCVGFLYLVMGWASHSTSVVYSIPLLNVDIS